MLPYQRCGLRRYPAVRQTQALGRMVRQMLALCPVAMSTNQSSSLKKSILSTFVPSPRTSFYAAAGGSGCKGGVAG